MSSTTGSSSCRPSAEFLISELARHTLSAFAFRGYVKRLKHEIGLERSLLSRTVNCRKGEKEREEEEAATTRACLRGIIIGRAPVLQDRYKKRFTNAS